MPVRLALFALPALPILPCLTLHCTCPYVIFPCVALLALMSITLPIALPCIASRLSLHCVCPYFALVLLVVHIHIHIHLCTCRCESAYATEWSPYLIAIPIPIVIATSIVTAIVMSTSKGIVQNNGRSQRCILIWK